MKACFVFIAAACVSFLAAPFVSASGSQKRVTDAQLKGGKVDLAQLPAEEGLKLKRRFKDLEILFVERAKARGKLSEAIRNGNQSEIENAQEEWDLLEVERKTMGLVNLNESEDFRADFVALSENSDFVWDYTNFHKDTATGRYIWEAQGMFDSGNDWASECFCSPYYFWYNLGGDEGFGLASLHKNINIYESQFWTLHDDLTTATNRSSNISTINARGAGWAWQDKVYAGGLWGKDYDSQRRFGWLVFSFVGGAPAAGTTISFQGGTAHTWDSTDVTGISIGGGGVGFSWASAGHQWTSAVSKPYTL